MAYEKQTWVTGDTITADKLNHMEDGIAAGGGKGIKILTFYCDDYNNPTGGLIKDGSADPMEFYTFAELYEMYQRDILLVRGINNNVLYELAYFQGDPQTFAVFNYIAEIDEESQIITTVRYLIDEDDEVQMTVGQMHTTAE